MFRFTALARKPLRARLTGRFQPAFILLGLLAWSGLSARDARADLTNNQQQDLSTRSVYVQSSNWTAAPSTTPRSIYVDLGATTHVQRLIISWGAAYAADFQVQLSNDATNWTTIKWVYNNSMTTDDLQGLSSDGRYIRLYATRAGTKSPYTLTSFLTYGVDTEIWNNLAHGKPVTASTDTANAAKTVDANTGTAWTGNDYDWISVDLGSSISVGEVRLTWNINPGQTFQLQTANRPGHWHTVSYINNNTSNVSDLRNLGVTARYVRVQVLASGNNPNTGANTGFQLAELEVYAGTTSSYPSGQTVRVMPLGDSLCMSEFFCWRQILWNNLWSNGYQMVDFVGSQQRTSIRRFDTDHEGHGGFTSDQINAGIVGWATSAQPDIVLLNIGTNDPVKHANDPTPWTANDSVNQVSQIIDNLRNVNPYVTVLVALLPYHGTFWDQYNAGLMNLAWQNSTNNSQINIVDLRTGFNPTPGIDTRDGAHYNAAGAQFAADHWYAALTPLLPSPYGYGAGRR